MFMWVGISLLVWISKCCKFFSDQLRPFELKVCYMPQPSSKSIKPLIQYQLKRWKDAWLVQIWWCTSNLWPVVKWTKLPYFKSISTIVFILTVKVPRCKFGTNLVTLSEMSDGLTHWQASSSRLPKLLISIKSLKIIYKILKNLSSFWQCKYDEWNFKHLIFLEQIILLGKNNCKIVSQKSSLKQERCIHIIQMIETWLQFSPRKK